MNRSREIHNVSVSRSNLNRSRSDSRMDPDRILGWIVGGVLIGLAFTDWTLGRLFRRPIAAPIISRFGLPTRAILVCGGILCVFSGSWYANWRHDHELRLTERSVVVMARAPGESVFPIEFVVTNDFERMTGVQLRCMVERFATDALDFLDADVTSRAEIPALEQGASFRFDCPAPRELRPPFPSADVRGAHVTVDVVFSVADRWRRLGVRQGFDLTVGNGAPSWTPEASVLLR
jgi:hypothetical protein